MFGLFSAGILGVEGLTPEGLVLLAGIVLSFLVELPWFGIAKWYDGLSPAMKRWVMVGLVVLTAAGIYGLGCSGFLGVVLPGVIVTCDVGGALALVQIALLAVLGLMSNQAAFLLNNRAHKKA